MNTDNPPVTTSSCQPPLHKGAFSVHTNFASGPSRSETASSARKILHNLVTGRPGAVPYNLTSTPQGGASHKGTLIFCLIP